MWAFKQIDAGRGADLLIVVLGHTNLVLLVSISHKHKVHWIPQFFWFTLFVLNIIIDNKIRI